MKKATILITLSSIFAFTGCDTKKEDATQQPLAEQVKTSTELNQTTDISVDNIFVRVSFPGQDVSAAFFTLNNNGTEDLEVKSISSNVSDAVEFHTMEMKGGNMIMRHMDKVIIPSNDKLVLSQGADHVMLLNLKEPLVVDSEVILTIEFTNGSTQEIKGLAQDLNDVEHKGNHEESHEEHTHEHEHGTEKEEVMEKVVEPNIEDDEHHEDEHQHKNNES